jgi:hypothetical protein
MISNIFQVAFSGGEIHQSWIFLYLATIELTFLHASLTFKIQVQLPAFFGMNLYELMYAEDLRESLKPAKALFALFRMFELTEQQRAQNCPTQIDHLQHMRKLPKNKITGTAYTKAHKMYTPITPAIHASITRKLTAADTLADPGWVTDATVLTTSNTARAAINQHAAVNSAKRVGDKVISWRRPFTQDLTEGMKGYLYRNGEHPELTQHFLRKAPGQVLDNQCGNVALGVANGTSCIYHSLIWTDPQERAQAEALIAAATTDQVLVPIPPNFIVVELPDQDPATWPAHLNLCVPSPNGLCAKVLIPIGMSTCDGDASITKGGFKIFYKTHGVDLAYALTVWKAQGKTLSHVIALLDNGPNGKAITFEILYVIKSRVRSVENLRCLGMEGKPQQVVDLANLRPHPLAIRYRQDIGADGFWVEGRSARVAANRRVVTDARNLRAISKTTRRKPGSKK